MVIILDHGDRFLQHRPKIHQFELEHQVAIVHPRQIQQFDEQVHRATGFNRRNL
jgi:hypothetical protein